MRQILILVLIMDSKKYLGQIVGGKYVKSAIVSSDIKQPKEHSGHRDHVRSTMARDYARELVQPHTEEFIDAYPQQAKRMGMIPEGEL